MRSLRPRRQQAARRGANIVEFAIVVPVFLLFVFGIVEVVESAIFSPILLFLVLGIIEAARGLMVREVLSDAARRACRTGILPGTDNTAIQNDVNDILKDNKINSTDATITIQVNGKTV